jgi:hypothetical protein
MKIGDKAIYTGTLKKLDPDTIGEIAFIGKDWASIVYKQNAGQNKVYAHSANFIDLKIVE